METIKSLINSSQFIYVDVGAKGGSRLFPQLKNNIHYIGFEPNADEHKQLKTKHSGYYNQETFLPFALDKQASEKLFHLTRNSSFSSFLKLDEVVFNQHYGLMHATHEWKAGFDIIDSKKVKTSTLNKVATDLNLPQIDFLKLDTQGTELDILKGGENLLSQQKIGIIFCEVEMVRIYKNQPIFFEIQQYLNQFNYVLVDCLHYPESRFFKGKKPNPHPFGKVYEKNNYGLVGDAIFAPDPLRVKLPNQLATQYGLLLAGMGYLSLSAAYLKQANKTDVKIAEIFQFLNQKTSIQKAKAFANNWLPPKLVYLLKKWFKK